MTKNDLLRHPIGFITHTQATDLRLLLGTRNGHLLYLPYVYGGLEVQSTILANQECGDLQRHSSKNQHIALII